MKTKPDGLIDKCLRWTLIFFSVVLALWMNDSQAIEGPGAGPNGGSIQMPGAF